MKLFLFLSALLLVIAVAAGWNKRPFTHRRYVSPYQPINHLVKPVHFVKPVHVVKPTFPIYKGYGR